LLFRNHNLPKLFFLRQNHRLQFHHFQQSQKAQSSRAAKDKAFRKNSIKFTLFRIAGKIRVAPALRDCAPHLPVP